MVKDSIAEMVGLKDSNEIRRAVQLLWRIVAHEFSEKGDKMSPAAVVDTYINHPELEVLGIRKDKPEHMFLLGMVYQEMGSLISDVVNASYSKEDRLKIMQDFVESSLDE